MPTVKITEKAAANRRLAVSLANMAGISLFALGLEKSGKRGGCRYDGVSEGRGGHDQRESEGCEAVREVGCGHW